MADTYLNVGETALGANFSNSNYFGNTGTEELGLGAGVTGATISQTIEQIDLPGSSSDYLYQQTGNILKVYSGATLVASITVQNDADGTALKFANGTTDVKVDATGMHLGTGLVPPGAPGAVDPGLGGGSGGTPGQTFNLTESSDTIPGVIGSKGTTDNSGDDLILAGTVNSGLLSGSTLGATDNLNGGTGNDTLRIVAEDTLASLFTGGDQSFTPQINSVENVEVQNLSQIGGDITVNLTNATGVEQVTGYNSPSGTGGDITFNDVRTNATVAAADWHAGAINAVFTNAALASGELTISTDTSEARYSIDTSGTNPGTTIDTLNIDATGGSSQVRVDTDQQITTNLVITGDATDLEVRNSFFAPHHSLDALTNVDATGFSGTLDLHLGGNDENVTVAGGTGDTTLSIGDGDNSIVTQDGNDNVTVGFGDNLISTAGGNDVVDISDGGDQKVNLGSGNDTLVTGTELTVDDLIDGGSGTDTLSVDVYQADFLSADSAFEAQMSNFEVLQLTGNGGPISQGDSLDVDLANLDNISNVVISADTQAGTAVAEMQQMEINSTGAFGAHFTIEGVAVDLPAGLDGAQAVQYILANYSDQIVTAYNANHGYGPGQGMLSVSVGPAVFSVPGDHLEFNYAQLSGDVPTPTVVEDTGSVGVNAAFGAATTTVPGTTEVAETQTLTVGTAPTATGLVTVNVNGTNVQTTLTSGQTTTQAAATIAAALSAAHVSNVASVTSAGAVVTINYSTAAGDAAQVTFNDTGTTGAAAAGATPQNYVAPAAETQTVAVNSGTDSNGGFVRVSDGTHTIDLNAGTDQLSQDQLGVFLAAHQSDIITAIPTIQAIGYDTLLNTLTFVYTAAGGDVPPITVSSTPGNFPDPSEHFDIVDGVNGSADGALLIDHMTSGGTVTLASANNGIITVDPSTSLGTESLNVVLSSGYDESAVGQYVFGSFETLHFTNSLGSQQDINVDGSDAQTITVAGSAGIHFTESFANLTSFDASAVTGTGSTGAVSIQTDTTSATTLVGGAGDDTIVGGSGKDTITGGNGNDNITGRAGADTLTGGAGADHFIFTAVSDSQGATVDTIKDFTSGTDKIDLSAIVQGTGVYSEEAANLGQVLTALSGLADGNTRAILDTSTSTLYVDVNGDGVLNNSDMAIQLTGVQNLSSNDFTFA